MCQICESSYSSSSSRAIMVTWRLFVICAFTVIDVRLVRACFSKHATTTANEDRQRKTDRDSNFNRFIPINPRCNYSSICGMTEADLIDYPRQEVASAVDELQARTAAVLRSHGNKASLARWRRLMSAKTVSRTVTNTMSTLVRSFDADGEGLCRSREVTITPAAAKNIHSKWRYLINNDMYRQAIRVQICNAPKKSCGRNVEIQTSLGETSVCRQKFVERPLVALDPLTGKPITEVFRIPFACVCYVREAVNPFKTKAAATSSSEDATDAS